jgi:tetratricopeptide (TPR) repeat protein
LGYYNPYYGSGYGGGGGGGYNYSQPIPVDYGSTYTAGAGGTQNPADAMLNDAIAAFKQGDYDGALDIVNKAIAQYPSDSVLHEFRALVLFAKADYQQAAATLHSVLAVGPGWDWTTLSSLYPNIQVYTDQLRALEGFVRNNPQDGGSRFVLAYHYMSAGHTDAARRQLQQVVQLVSNDRVATDLLNMLAQRNQGPTASPGTSPGTVPTPRPPAEAGPGPRPESAAPAEAEAKAIDPAAVVGTWHASREDGSKFDLKIGNDSTFNWKFSPPKGQANEFSGKYTIERNVLALERKEGGSMVGEVALENGKKFNFKALGAPPDDPGLDFSRR